MDLSQHSESSDSFQFKCIILLPLILTSSSRVHSFHVTGPAGLTDTQGHKEKQASEEQPLQPFRDSLGEQEGCQLAVVYLESPTCQPLKNYQGRETRAARDVKAPSFTYEHRCQGQVTD